MFCIDYKGVSGLVKLELIFFDYYIIFFVRLLNIILEKLWMFDNVKMF